MKSNKNNSSDINDRAAEWVLKNDRGLTAEEQDAFTDWLSERIEHRNAYAEHRFAWAELARLAGLQNTDYAPIVPDLLGANRTPWHRKYMKFSKWAVALPVAASIAFAIIYVVMAVVKEERPVMEVSQSMVVNQITQNRLEDGSVVDLNRGAVIETYFTREQRFVKLISGEANFNVEKDRARPFIVEASGVRLRAVGTVFNVRLEDQVVDILVTEGTVAVQHRPVDSSADNTPVEESLVRRNFRAVVDLQPEIPRVSVDPVSEAELGEELLWQPRLIDFVNAPLSQIVGEFNRRNPMTIEIRDEEIRSLRFTSIFWSNNVESFVRLLEANYGITTEVLGENQILLKKAPEAL